MPSHSMTSTMRYTDSTIAIVSLNWYTLIDEINKKPMPPPPTPSTPSSGQDPVVVSNNVALATSDAEKFKFDPAIAVSQIY